MSSGTRRALTVIGVAAVAWWAWQMFSIGRRVAEASASGAHAEDERGTVIFSNRPAPGTSDPDELRRAAL